jgi:hypothetical protein
MPKAMNINRLYEQNFHAWINQQIAFLNEKKFNALDINHLIEELEGMAKKDKSELVNRLVILIAHLLKWQYQANKQGKSWQATIDEQRDQITAGLLVETPHLKAYLLVAINKSYQRAVKLAAKETGYTQSHFPKECPYSPKLLLNENYYPQVEQSLNA